MSRPLPEHPRTHRPLITLGAPFDLYGLGLPTLAAAAMVTAAGTLGVPGMATLRCLTGSCCRDFRDTLRRPLPEGMPFTSIYSRGDRTVPAHASIDPAARNVEVTGGHLSLLTGTAARRAVAATLDGRAACPKYASTLSLGA